MGLWLLSTIWRDSRDLPIMDTLRTNIHLSSTLRFRSTTQKSGDGFKARVWQSGESSQEAFTTDPRIKVRVLIIWRVRILGLVIWIYSTGFHMCPRFYCGPQGAHHLGCSLDHCRVPRTQWHYQGLLHMLWPLWGVSWRSTPKAAAATVFEFGAASLVVTRSSLLFMEAIAIFSLSGRLSSFARLSGAGWQVSQHVWILSFCIILSSQPTWPEKAKSHQRIFHGEGHAWFYRE